MKTKRLLLVISAISLLSFLFTSCQKDEEMDRGGTGGPGYPPVSSATTESRTYSISDTKQEAPRDFTTPKD